MLHQAELPLPDYAMSYERYDELRQHYEWDENAAPHTFWKYIKGNDIKQKFFVVSVQMELWNYDGVAYVIVSYRSLQHGYHRSIRTSVERTKFEALFGFGDLGQGD